MHALILMAALAAAPQPSPKGSRADAVRAVKLDSLFNATPGSVDRTRVLYADLNGDGVEEAIVPLVNGGGVIAVAVYGFDDAGLLRPMLLHAGRKLEFELRAGLLVITEPVYASVGDASPSGSTVMRYGWNGRALVLQSSEASPKK